MLALPNEIRACLFDLDGVLTNTATIHAQAWKQMFDDFLRDRGCAPFALPRDYEEHVDGKPRLDGVRSFLESRGIAVPEETVRELGERKNDLVLELIRAQGVEPYEGSVRFVEAARDAGLRRGVVSSSSNCRDVLKAAGIDHLFEAVIDGVVAERDGLRGKPAPDTFLAGARALGAEPGQAAVFEDALAGVQAGRAGDFRCVVGVDRADHADELERHGATVVVRDLAELLRDP
jgi:beta-phosphoglucomutase family hydrolase